MTREKFQNRYRIPSARAIWHDYNGGMYFVTICTAGMNHFFGEINNGEMQLNVLGEYAEECIGKMENLHSDVFVPLYVIMPNHIHLIICVDGALVETSYYGVSTEGNSPTGRIVETSYYGVSTEGNSPSGVSQDARHGVYTMTTKNGIQPKNKKMQSIAQKCGRLSHIVSRFKSAITKYANKNHIPFAWQTRFHDRVIRHQEELNRIAEYIENNPTQWDKDNYNVEVETYQPPLLNSKE